MNPNSQNQRSNFSERSHAPSEDAVKKFSEAKRLDAADQRVAAINLGKLAALLRPQDPLDGVRQIVLGSGLAGVQEKRKRFFRLPGEEAPISSKDGTYNASPTKCMSLAKAAGRLLSGSRDKGLQEKEEKAALRILIQGTSFLPSYVPATQAEQSIKGLLEEYAVRLAEAIEQRTRITELWQALETTPVEIDVSNDPMQPSSYGADAVFPSQLLHPSYKDYIKYGQFKPARYTFDNSWAEPSLVLGYTITTYNMFALKIPSDKSHLFPEITTQPDEHRDPCSVEVNDWLESIGFDVVEHRFRDGLTGRYQVELDKVTIAFIHTVGIGVRKGPQNKVEVELSVWQANKSGGYSSHDFIVSTKTLNPMMMVSSRWLEKDLSHYIKNTEAKCPIEYVTIGPEFSDDDNKDDPDALEIYIEKYSLNCLLVEDFDPFHPRGKILMFNNCFSLDFWEDDDDYQEYEAMKSLRGWVDEPNCAKLLLGESNIKFFPTVSEAEPEAGAARAGSIAASILENARVATPENRISQLLIDRVALTAETGLRFHDALLETSRASLANI
jgi:hypothetical protein